MLHTWVCPDTRERRQAKGASDEDGNPLSARPTPRRNPEFDERLQLLIEAVVDYGIFLLDPQGHVLTWNSGAERLKGYTRDEIVGKHFPCSIHRRRSLRAGPTEELRRARQHGRFEDEGWRVRKDGSRFWANVVITALHDASGELSGFAKITRDLTERRRHEEQLRASEERLRLLVESVQDYAIFMLDPDGTVRGWNAGAQAHQGLPRRRNRRAGTSASSTRRRTSRPASPQRNCEAAAARAASKTRAGGCARTARCSGPTW